MQHSYTRRDGEGAAGTAAGTDVCGWRSKFLTNPVIKSRPHHPEVETVLTEPLRDLTVKARSRSGTTTRCVYMRSGLCPQTSTTPRIVHEIEEDDE